jgi:hypothetical protein
MNLISHSHREIVAIVLEPSSSTQGVTDFMTGCLDWAEEHWEAVAVMVSLLCALSLAALLAVTFNVVSTKLDRPDHGAVGASASSERERPSRSDRSALDGDI